MAENSNIEWTHHTFNPWRGCTKVSAGCKNCYAETFSKRNPTVLGIWGDKGTRPVASESYWKIPLQWDKAAAAAGERHRVFCASLADVFEDRDELEPHRLRLLDLIRQTPNLDWLLLTKRPENIMPALVAAVPNGKGTVLEWPFMDWLSEWVAGCPPANVWLGTSVENQEAADTRIPHLLKSAAAVHFLSMEPLLGPVVLEAWLPSVDGFVATPTGPVHVDDGARFPNWVIVGGESGGHARPMHPAWVQGIAAQCLAAGVPFLFKQWGEWGPTQAIYDMYPHSTTVIPARLGYKFQDMEPGRVFEYPGQHPDYTMWKLGKHNAGRLLDGQLYDQFPAPSL